MNKFHLFYSFVRTSLFYQGTIDKAYPRMKGGYSFEICEAATKKILERVKPKLGFEAEFKTCCKLDSQDITEKERSAIH